MLILCGFSSTSIMLIPGVREPIVHGLITTAGRLGSVRPATAATCRILGLTASPTRPLACPTPGIKLVAAMATTQPRKAAKPPKKARVRASAAAERYTLVLLARFPLENATDGAEYARGVRSASSASTLMGSPTILRHARDRSRLPGREHPRVCRVASRCGAPGVVGVGRHRPPDIRVRHCRSGPQCSAGGTADVLEHQSRFGLQALGEAPRSVVAPCG